MCSIFKHFGVMYKAIVELFFSTDFMFLYFNFCMVCFSFRVVAEVVDYSFEVRDFFSI